MALVNKLKQNEVVQQPASVQGSGTSGSVEKSQQKR